MAVAAALAPRPGLLRAMAAPDPAARPPAPAAPGGSLGPPLADVRRVKFCPLCGAATVSRVPPGDERPRDVCSRAECCAVHYTNPKLVVGAVCILDDDKVLLCRRAIEPCKGRWGFPQGFMELGESAREGAAREAHEEAHADVAVGPLLAVYNTPNQVQLLYLARLRSADVSPGPESSEVRLLPWDELPRDELAFPTVAWALDYARQVAGTDSFPPQERTKVVGAAGPSSGSFVIG